MKHKMDERQHQEENGVAAKAFCVMYIICSVAIIVQLIFVDRGLVSVVGETVALLGGATAYLAGSIRKGNFSSKDISLSRMEVISMSIVCSGIFSAFYGAIISQKVNESISIGKYVGYFFVGICFLCFITLTIMGRCSEYIQQKNERKYKN